MSEAARLRQQRDRLLAFAFAGADLLIETDPDGAITYALGAAKGLTGIDEGELIGMNWLDIFDKADRQTLIGLKARAQSGSRCGPILVTLYPKDVEPQGLPRKIVFTGIKMPDSEMFFVTMSASNVLMSKAAEKNRQAEDKAILSKTEFIEAAKEAMSMAQSLGQDAEMTLLDIANPALLKKKLGDEGWRKFTEKIDHLLRDRSIDGEAAAQIAEGRYSLIHGKELDSDAIREQIAALSRDSDPTGKGVDVSSKTVTADLGNLSEQETSRALLYTINDFERKGTQLTITSLNSSFKAYVTANAQKISEFKDMAHKMKFNLHFQPIVDLETLAVCHHEMLTRFHDGGSPYEWIVFGEDIGMAPDFDIAVCDRAINYILYKTSKKTTKFAVNLSGQSIQKETFFKYLCSKLFAHEGLSERLMFEITESTNIQDLERVNAYIQQLQKMGYKVCLDDFGAGSASFQYLHQLHVDYVKIDGNYTRKILDSDRDASMVKNLVRMCHDLNVRVIAEMIETQEQADKVKSLGVQYGQGFLYGKPEPQPRHDVVSARSKESA